MPRVGSSTTSMVNDSNNGANTALTYATASPNPVSATAATALSASSSGQVRVSLTDRNIGVAAAASALPKTVETVETFFARVNKTAEDALKSIAASGGEAIFLAGMIEDVELKFIPVSPAYAAPSVSQDERVLLEKSLNKFRADHENMLVKMQVCEKLVEEAIIQIEFLYNQIILKRWKYRHCGPEVNLTKYRIESAWRRCLTYRDQANKKLGVAFSEFNDRFYRNEGHQ